MVVGVERIAGVDIAEREGAPPRKPPLAMHSRAAFVRLPELRDVELLHPEHRLHRPGGTRRVRPAEVGTHLAGNDLPGQAEPVLQPAAPAGLPAALDERVPVTV